MIDILTVGIFIVQDEKYVYLNKEALNILGETSLSNGIGKNIFDYVVPESVNNLKELLSNDFVSNSKRSPVEIDFEMLDGRLLTIEYQRIEVVFNGQPAIQVVSRDVSQSKQIANDLNLLSLVAQKTSNIVIITDQLRQITWVNEGFTRITGYTLDEVVGSNPAVFLQNEQTNPDTILQIREKLDKKEPVRCEIYNVGKYGNGYWIDMEIQPIFGDTGIFTGFISIESDITDKKQRELELNESKEKYQMIFDTLSEGVSLNEVLRNEQGEFVDFKILDVNEAFYKIADFNKKMTVIGASASKLYNLEASFLNSFWNIHKKHLTTIQNEYFNPVSKKCFSISISPSKDDKFVISFFDITSQKEALNALLESEDRYKSLVELLPDSVLVYRNEKIVYVNSASMKLLALDSEEEVIGKSLFDFIHPDYRSTLLNRINSINDIDYQSQIELNLIRKDGIEVMIELTRQKIVFEGEQSVLVILRNITDKVKLQTKLNLLREEKSQYLLQQSQVRTHALIKGQEDERKRISRDLHDGLGQILTATKLQLEMIDLEKMQDEKVSRDFAKIYQLVMDTIDEVRRISEDLSPATLHQFGLLSAVDNLVFKVEQLNSAIRIDVDSNIGRERFNLDLEINVFRIIQECLNNAIKHAKCTQIDIKINLIYDVLRIVIKDNGIGFNQEGKLENISPDYSGKGLKNIVERVLIFKGEVDITSSHGTSTEISFQVGLNILK